MNKQDGCTQSDIVKVGTDPVRVHCSGNFRIGFLHDTASSIPPDFLHDCRARPPHVRRRGTRIEKWRHLGGRNGAADGRFLTTRVLRTSLKTLMNAKIVFVGGQVIL